VTGNTATATQHNDPLEDLQNDMNTPRPIVAGGSGQDTAVKAHDAFSTKGSDIASAATTNIASATGAYVHITGATTITAFNTAAAGVVRILEFDAALTLTHNATSLILPFARNITTAAGDVAVMVSEGSGNWRCVSYSNKPTAATKLTVFAASGTFTPDAKMIDCVAEAQGGGASGAGAPACAAGQFSVGSGGQAGSYARGRFTRAQIGASQAVTIGGGGTGAAGAIGNAGGSTSLGALLVAVGGNTGSLRGPVTNTNTGFAQGGGALQQATAGDYLGWSVSPSPGLLTPNDGSLGGNGGATSFGGNGIGFAGAGQGGAAKANTGSGGGGGGGASGSSATAGGAGGTGVLIITENLAPF
jgi:hypothetical protein